MAIVVECPFCRTRAKAPERAVGAMGRCPRCGCSFTFAALDDARLSESAPADSGSETAGDKADGGAIAAAIAQAAAAANGPPRAQPTGDVQPAARKKRLHPSRVGAALAIFLGGIALAAASVPVLHILVRPLSVLATLTGLAGIALAATSAWRRMILPVLGTAAAAAVLVTAWLFPALLGPAFEFSRRRPEPAPVGFAAVPLGGAPALAEVPEWTDARRYALQRDALRVQVIRHGLLPPEKAVDKSQPAPKDRLLVGVRVSLEGRLTQSIERDARFGPTLTDDAGKSYAVLKAESLDSVGGAVPASEEDFVFETPAPGWKTLRLEFPAERWQTSGPFRFAIHASDADVQSKK